MVLRSSGDTQGAGAAFLLLDHKANLGKKIISKITVFFPLMRASRDILIEIRDSKSGTEAFSQTSGDRSRNQTLNGQPSMVNGSEEGCGNFNRTRVSTMVGTF